MNINLNLATRPYIELRSVYARLRIVAGALVVLALPVLLVVHSEEAKARLAEARASQLQGNIALLRRQQASARALALEGPNANVLTEAAFLNDLFRRKAFSWTATMADLETTLPYGVQVQTIAPSVMPDGHVIIRMRVSGGREKGVELIRNLERSRHFMAPRLVTEALEDQNSNGGNNGRQSTPVSAQMGGPAAGDVTFDIIADYRPLPNSHTGAGARSSAIPASAHGSATRGSAFSGSVPGTAQLTNPDPTTAAPVSTQAKPAPGMVSGNSNRSAFGPLPAAARSMAPAGAFGAPTRPARPMQQTQPNDDDQDPADSHPAQPFGHQPAAMPDPQGAR